MRKLIVMVIGLIAWTLTSAQTANTEKGKISGKVTGSDGKAIAFASITLQKAKDSSLVKAFVTDKEGLYELEGVAYGNYLLEASSVGFEKKVSAVTLDNKQATLNFSLKPGSKTLNDVVVKSKKPLIEVKADKTVFNVESSINAQGSNALELLSKSPGVVVDNNENISVKGKTGTKIYVDGKMMQLDNKDLAAYLKSINSNDIEAIEMITNPSAKYDASGNAGIINIRLKKNKKYGTNGNVNLGYVQGITPKANGSVSLNYRDKKINLFSNVGGNIGNYNERLDLYRIQNDSLFDQHSRNVYKDKSINAKAGADLFLDSKNTIGVMVTGNFNDNTWFGNSSTNIYYQPTGEYVKQLKAFNTIPGSRTNANGNLNYRYADTAGKTINVDADYGLFRGAGRSYQPNNYYSPNGSLLYQLIYRNNTPTDIDIYTVKADVEINKWKGKLGYGAKAAYVRTKNTFDFYNVINGNDVKQLGKSNSFDYKENVNAAYVNYNRQLNSKWGLQAGLRAEQTNSEGVLTRADGLHQADDKVKRNYLDFFPSGALTWTVDKKNTLNLTYSRRIDRPTYQDLNPFENKLDELTYQKGNAFLKPQYTDNIELTHTFMGFINTTLNYSHVKDYSTMITDTANKNATFIQQRNLASQQIYGLNIGAPLPIAKWWNGYVNVWGNRQQFKGEFKGTKLNRSYTLYGLYMQNNFTISQKKGLNAEISGWYNGKSVWGGTWVVKPMGGFDVGLQKTILKGKGSLKASVTDVLWSQFWKSKTDFGGVSIDGQGKGESRTFRLNFSYRFGNNNVKAARDRKTGLESEAGRIKR
ncbi:MAG: TonB-dependent receptor [Sphingobacteriales bacterium]|nr:MAG: TonB-dependent receptor [Sphingobacteriales bacterium]